MATLTAFTIGPRVTFSQQFNGIEIYIRSPREIFSLILIPFWLIFWTMGGISAIKSFLGGDANPFLFIWIVGWALGWAFMIYIWFWTAFGKEIIFVGQGILTLKHDILGFGRKKEIQLYELSNLRAAGQFGSPSSWNNNLAFWGISGGTIAIDSRGKTQRFGIHLEEGEAMAVVKEIEPYLLRR